MEIFLIIFLITSVLLWGFSAAIWTNDSWWDLLIRLVCIGMFASTCLLLLGLLTGLLVIL